MSIKRLQPAAAGAIARAAAAETQTLDRTNTIRMNRRKYITPGTRLSVPLTSRERDLIIERAFLDPEIEARLRSAVAAGPKFVVELTLDDVDDLLGCVAAEANHSDDKKARRVLDAVCDRLSRLLDQFTDEVPAIPQGARGVKRKPTDKQGQYLAFIHFFTKIHEAPPAEADMQRFFKVSPPAVHQMILTLERRGFIDRVPGKARSVRLKIARAELPDLE